MTKHISQRQAHRLKRELAALELEIRHLHSSGDNTRERYLVRYWKEAPGSLCMMIAIINRLGFRVEAEVDNDQKVISLYGVRRKLP